MDGQTLTTTQAGQYLEEALGGHTSAWFKWLRNDRLDTKTLIPFRVTKASASRVTPGRQRILYRRADIEAFVVNRKTPTAPALATLPAARYLSDKLGGPIKGWQAWLSAQRKSVTKLPWHKGDKEGFISPPWHKVRSVGGGTYLYEIADLDAFIVRHASSPLRPNRKAQMSTLWEKEPIRNAEV